MADTLNTFRNTPGTDAILALCSKFAAALPARMAAIRDQFESIDLANWQIEGVQNLHRQVHSLIGAADTFGRPCFNPMS